MGSNTGCQTFWCAEEARLALAQPSSQAVAYATLGTIRLRQKKLDESRQFLAQALHLNPKLLGARLTLGQVYLRQGKTGMARQTLQDTFKLAPDNPAVRMNLAQLESMDGNYKASLELVSPIAESLRSSPDGLVLLAGTYLGLGNKDSARKLVSDWMALGEGVPPPLVIEFAKPLPSTGSPRRRCECSRRPSGRAPPRGRQGAPTFICGVTF